MDREHDERRNVLGVKFLHQPAVIDFDSLGRKGEGLGNLDTRSTFHDELQDLRSRTLRLLRGLFGVRRLSPGWHSGGISTPRLK